MARVARSQLERLHERFVAPDQEQVRGALVSTSRAIEDWMNVLRNGGTRAPPTVSLPALQTLIERHEDRSLYNAEVLRAALAGP